MPYEPPSPLGVKIRWDGVVVTVILDGELDCITVPALTASLHEVAAAHPDRVVLDLGGLEFADVAGARALGKSCTSLAAGCPVIVRAPQPPVRRVFDLTGLGPHQHARAAASGPQPTAARLALLSRVRAELDRAEDLYGQAQAAMAWSHALVEASYRIRHGQREPSHGRRKCSDGRRTPG
jgi:anti-anti-sigma factor